MPVTPDRSFDGMLGSVHNGRDESSKKNSGDRLRVVS